MGNDNLDETKENKKHMKTQGDEDMPAIINIIEKERNSYIDGMAQYLERLKRMSVDEIQLHSKKVLVEAEIIDNDGNLINYREYKSTKIVKGK